jgi:hypothetical protein
VTGLTPGMTYYFALRTVDEAGNLSGLSNSGIARMQGGEAASSDDGSSGDSKCGLLGIDLLLPLFLVLMRRRRK